MINIVLELYSIDKSIAILRLRNNRPEIFKPRLQDLLHRANEVDKVALSLASGFEFLVLQLRLKDCIP